MNTHFHPPFNACLLPAKIQKNLVKKVTKNFEKVEIGPKVDSFAIFLARFELPLKSKIVTLQLINACHQMWFQKNLMSRFREKFKSVILGLFPLLILKNELHRLYIYPLSPTSCKKFEKSNEPILRKRCYRAEFLEPSGIKMTYLIILSKNPAKCRSYFLSGDSASLNYFLLRMKWICY